MSEPAKVHTFWEGHKILWNLHSRFDVYYIGKSKEVILQKICDLLTKPQLYRGKHFVQTNDLTICLEIWAVWLLRVPYQIKQVPKKGKSSNIDCGAYE